MRRLWQSIDAESRYIIRTLCVEYRIHSPHPQGDRISLTCQTGPRERAGRHLPLSILAGAGAGEFLDEFPCVDSGMDGAGTCGRGHKRMVAKGAFIVRPPSPTLSPRSRQCADVEPHATKTHTFNFPPGVIDN